MARVLHVADQAAATAADGDIGSTGKIDVEIAVQSPRLLPRSVEAAGAVERRRWLHQRGLVRNVELERLRAGLHADTAQDPYVAASFFD